MSVEDVPKYIQDNYEIHEWKQDFNDDFRQIIVGKWTYPLT